jgi:hypothetical protein
MDLSETLSLLQSHSVELLFHQWGMLLLNLPQDRYGVNQVRE